MLDLIEVARGAGGTLLRGDAELPIRSVVHDSREVVPGALFVAIRGERTDGHLYLEDAASRGAVAALVASDVPVGAAPRALALVSVPEPRAALWRLAAHSRAMWPGRVLAVTGSGGKTTTKEMLHHVLGQSLQGSRSPRSYNNDLGVPLTLLGAQPGDDYVIVEIGTSAPGEIAALAELARPHVAVVTSVGPTHLEGLGSVEAVAEEKASLLRLLQPGGLAVVNGDSPLVRGMARDLAGTRPDVCVVRCGFGESELEVRGTVLEAGLASLRLSIPCLGELQVPMGGRHNATNALLAVVTALRAFPSACPVPRCWDGFQPPPMRWELRRVRGATVINDGYNANPMSMAAALEMLAEAPGRRLAVLGEMRELGADGPALHRQVGEACARANPELLVTVGAAACEIERGALAAGLDPARVRAAQDLEEAARHVGPRLGEDAVLLVKASRAAGIERLLSRL